jgi:hypothetical protein
VHVFTARAPSRVCPQPSLKPQYTPARFPARAHRSSNSSLLVCLDAIHHIAKAPIIPDFRFISRSICALIAKQVLRTGQLEETEPRLRWLQEVTGETSNTIFNASIATQDRINFKSFVYAVPSSSNQAGDLPTDPFKETLAILLDVRTGQGLKEAMSTFTWSPLRIGFLKKLDGYNTTTLNAVMT